jgi:hypothetical protein
VLTFTNMKNDKNSLMILEGKSNHTGIPELEESKVHIIVEIIEYVPNSVVSKTIIKKQPEILQFLHLLWVKSWLKRLLILTTIFKSLTGAPK